MNIEITILVFLISIITIGLSILSPFNVFMYLIVLTMVLTGTFQYFLPNLSVIAWSCLPISMGIFIRYLFSNFHKNNGKMPKIALAMILFGFVSILSIAGNYKHYIEAILSFKNYFQFWLVPFIFYYGKFNETQLKKILILILIIGFIQTPVSLFQYFFLIDKISRTASGDSVVGTFGGSMYKGGSSGAQTTFLAVLVFYFFSVYLIKKNKFPLKYLFYTFIITISILLNETKIFFVYILFGTIVIYFSELTKNYVKTFIVTFLLLLITAAIFASYYKYQTHTNRFEKINSINEYFDKKFKKNFSKQRIGNSLNRTSAPVYWFKSPRVNKDYFRMFFGFGLGSSKSMGLSDGYMVKEPENYGKNIGVTLFTRLLWDVGIIGTCLYFLIYLLNYFYSNKIYKNKNISEFDKSIMLSNKVASIIFVLCIFYDKYLINTQALSFFSQVCIGLTFSLYDKYFNKYYIFLKA